MKRTVTILILCLILTLTLPIFAAGASAESSELFSARDLSASYDEEVFSITLSGNTASTDSDHVTVSGGRVFRDHYVLQKPLREPPERRARARQVAVNPVRAESH